MRNQSWSFWKLLLSASILAVVTAFLVAQPGLGAPEENPATSDTGKALPPIVTLQLQDTTVFTAAAPNAMRSGAQCDSDGDAFIQLASFAGSPLHLVPSSSISEVIRDGKRIVVYQATELPASDYPHAKVTSFGVLPDGDLYALIFTRRYTSDGKMLSEPKYYVEHFKNDGTRDSITPIQEPPDAAHWYADVFAPFSDRNFLISGTITNVVKRPGASAWRPFTAIYSSRGRFIAEVTLPDDITNDFKEGEAAKPAGAQAKNQGSSTEASKPRQYFEIAITTGDIVSGPDGNVWVLRASDPARLYAIDSGGQVIHYFKISPPAPGLTPFDFGFAGSEQVFLDFDRPPNSPASGSSELLGIFNTVLQHFDALYALPEEANKGSRGLSALACSDGNGGFLYLGSAPPNHLALFDYSPR